VNRRWLTYATVTTVGALAALSAAAAVLLLQPQWLIDFFARRSPQVLYFAETDQPLVALTLDDGPDPHSTPQILDVLERYEARATFFLISDRVRGNEGLVQQMVEAGHELGNHMTQDRPSIRLSSAEFEAALLEADSVLSHFTDVRWFRPAGGWYNDAMLSIIEAHGYRCALGSVHPYDATIPSSAFAARHTLRGVRPGAVVILHDGGGRGLRTAAALERILPELKRRGLRTVTLSELAAEGEDSHDSEASDR
jgi:peptidoglycan/xylan/chitin deacetylase (PgdA/CDA1 family)